MARNTLLWRSLAIGGSLALVLAACGTDDGADETTESPEATEDAAADETDDAAASGEGDGVLTIGTLLPETGSLASFGPPMFGGVTLAVEEINEAGGVLGNDVVQIDTDSGDTTTNIAQQSVDSLLAQDSDAIIGAASSSVSLSVLDKIIGAEVVMVSPANTSTTFTTYEDDGFYWRTAPSDVLQGRILGDAVLQDGYQNIAIMALQDAYGETLVEETTKSLEDGGATVVFSEFYDPNATDFSAILDEAASTNPDAVVLIAFDETRTIIPQAAARNFGPQDVPYFFVDGNLLNFSEDFETGTLTGTKGTQPGADAGDEFRQRLEETYGDVNQVYNYAGESYDAAILVALAAVAAGDDSGPSIAAQLQDVSTGGTECTSFAECVELLEAGEDIDYNGISGPVEWDEVGDPTAASIGIFEYGDDNTAAPVDFIFNQL